MLLTYCTGQMRRRLLLFKKIFDFVSALVLLVLVSPILLLAAAAIRLSSPGPIFFIQERIGFNKRRFKLYKFRTMIPDAENRISDLEHLNEIKGAAFKLKDDPRITPVGKILRKLSIDELPQLFNVVKGDMSLVGPRPLPIRDYKGFNTDWHRRRFCVKPGITCLWQVSGRNNVSFEEWMSMDMQYIDTWSPMLDMKILLKTVPAVLSGNGASWSSFFLRKAVASGYMLKIEIISLYGPIIHIFKRPQAAGFPLYSFTILFLPIWQITVV